MKRLLLVLSFSGAQMCGQDLSAVRSVYLMPMGHGLEQYLANRLTNERLFQVVTDPKLADTVFTDHIGASFEAKLADLTPKPEPVSPPPPAADKSVAALQAGSPVSGPANKLASPAASSSFGQGKGTVFLVDLKSHHVLWSAYQPSKGSTPNMLDSAASDIVGRLKRDLKPK